MAMLGDEHQLAPVDITNRDPGIAEFQLAIPPFRRSLALGVSGEHPPIHPWDSTRLRDAGALPPVRSIQGGICHH